MPLEKRPDRVTRAFQTAVDNPGLETLFDSLTDVQFWIKNRHGQYVRVNRAFLMNYGLASEAKVVGKTDHELFPAYLADQYTRDDRLVLAGRQVLNRVELVGGYDGTASWFVTHKIPIRARNGRIAGSAGITRDLQKEYRAFAPYRPFVEVIEYIKEHCTEPLHIRDLARRCGLSERTFARRFKHCFMVAPLQYVKKLRIMRACRLLVTTDLPLSAIAVQSGFCDQSYLTKEFHKDMRQTPRQYRQRYAVLPRL